MADERLPVGPGQGRTDEDERRRRLLWLLLAAALLLVLLFVVCSGGGDDDVAQPTTTAPAVAAAPTTSPEGPTLTSAPQTVPTTTPAPAAPTQTTIAVDTTEAGPIDVSGVWAFLVDVTKATEACSGEENEAVQEEQVTIQQNGTVLTVTGLNESDPAWNGQIAGNTVTFAGERDEDDGRTTASFTLTVDDAGTTLVGQEAWSWTGPGGSCPGSQSEVSAHRP